MRPAPTSACRLALGCLLVVAATGSLGPAPDARALPSGTALPLGDADLVETRATQVLAAGVTLTRITRGAAPAAPEEIGTTSGGPWRISVLSIDLRVTRGHLEVTHGGDLARTERTTDLVRAAGATAGVNASFFTFSGRYPGVPVGLNVVDGRLLSAPAARAAEVDLLVDSVSDEVRIGRLRWSGRVENRDTGTRVRLRGINRPPVVPAPCADLVDPTECTEAGEIVRITPEFGPTTPAGPGSEVVLGPKGCVVSTAPVRGTALAAGQTALQATGSATAALAEVARGCPRQRVTLTDEQGDTVPLRPGTFGVNGRYRLLAEGRVVVPEKRDSFFARHPRTLAGTTGDGRFVMATIDGRQAVSVGATLAETAAVAQALGLREAINLDGGGSTAMVARGSLVSSPSGSAERAVGDALVFVQGPARPVGRRSPARTGTAPD